MKRLLITMSVMCFLMADPNPVGNWKLSGLKVDYLHITRENAEVVLTDAYNFGIAVPVQTIPEGVVFQRFVNGPFTLPIIDAAQLNLNVNLYNDGTGAIAEGSFYPDIDLIEGTCITTSQIFPVSDAFVFEVGDETTFPATNILGIEGLNSNAGTQAWGFGINQSSTFDAFSAFAVPERIPEGSPYIALADGTILEYSCETGIIGGACAQAGFDPQTQLDECLYALTAGGAMAGIQASIGQCMAADYATSLTYFGGLGYLHGSGNGGWFNLDAGNSQMGQDLDVDFILEWDGIDGPLTGSGYGDDPEVDENDDGSLFDRVFGLPYIPATYTHATCPLAPGLDAPLAGDLTGEVAALVFGQCLDGVEDNVEAQCDAADLDGDGVGTPVEAVTGLCVGASQGDDFAAGCAAYGPSASVFGACQALGFDDETCAAAGQQGADAVEAYCQYLSGGYTCEQAGIDPCAVLTDITFATGLCGTLAGALTTSETCDEWAASFTDEWLDANAVQGVLPGMPTAGYTCTQYGGAIEDACIDVVDYANDMYLMDPSLSAWGYFLTYNAASVQQYQAAGYSLEQIAYYFPSLFADDSGVVFDPACYATGSPVDCAGKLLMHFEPLCINELEARQIVAEFVDLNDLCEATGDAAPVCNDLNGDGDTGDVVWADYAAYLAGEFILCEAFDPACFPVQECVVGDGVTNVVDVVYIVNSILGDGSAPLGGYAGCQADVNQDDIVNVVDIVVIVNAILGGRTVEEDATEATILFGDNNISIQSDGYIGGVDMTVEFSGDLLLDFSENHISDYVLYEDNTARIIVASEQSINNVFDITSGTVTSIKDVTLVTSNDGSFIELSSSDIEISGTPDTFSVGSAYPNPFNPSTNLSLELNTTADISVKVFNIMGQLVDVIAEGTYSPNTYNWTWNAENLASGVYLVRTQVGDKMDNQKIMLLK